VNRSPPDQTNELAIVRGHEDRGSAGIDLAQQIHDLEREIRIQVASGLVGDDEHGIVHERARDRNALLLAAGEILGIRVHAVLQAHPLEDLKCTPPLLSGRDAEDLGHK
jgi:hypothetical protein